MNIDYAELLKQYRKIVFVAKRLPAKLGVPCTTVNRWETGKFFPTIQMKKKLYCLFKKARLIK